MIHRSRQELSPTVEISGDQSIPRVVAGRITGLLVDWSQGNGEAIDSLMPLVYDELRHLARGRRRRQWPDGAVRTTSLVHETYLRLIDQDRVRWRNRCHFYSTASHLMRRVLIDEARRQASVKRGGRVVTISFEGLTDFSAAKPAELIAVDEALRDLGILDPELGKIVEMRFFGGFSNREVGGALGISISTVTRRVRLARAWLMRYLKGEEGDRS